MRDVTWKATGYFTIVAIVLLFVAIGVAYIITEKGPSGALFAADGLAGVLALFAALIKNKDYVIYLIGIATILFLLARFFQYLIFL